MNFSANYTCDSDVLQKLNLSEDGGRFYHRKKFSAERGVKCVSEREALQDLTAFIGRKKTLLIANREKELSLLWQRMKEDERKTIVGHTWWSRLSRKMTDPLYRSQDLEDFFSQHCIPKGTPDVETRSENVSKMLFLSVKALKEKESFSLFRRCHSMSKLKKPHRHMLKEPMQIKIKFPLQLEVIIGAKKLETIVIEDSSEEDNEQEEYKELDDITLVIKEEDSAVRDG